MMKHDCIGLQRTSITAVCLGMVLSMTGCDRSTDDLGSRTPTPSPLAVVAEKDTDRIRFLEVEGALSKSVYRDGHETGVYALPETTGGGLALADFDRDGQLDVMAAGGGQFNSPPKSWKGLPGSLHRGLGGFRFHECSDAARIGFSETYNSAVIAADWDNDGCVDVLVTGYSGLQLFHNMGDGTFERCVSLDDDTLWSSGGAFADIDQDGDLDLYVVHYADWSPENHPVCPSRYDPKVQDYCGPTDFKGLPDALYLNQGDGTWTNVSHEVDVGQGRRGLGVMAADLDGDRDIDFYVANDVEPNMLLRNDGESGWTEIGQRAGVACNDLGKAEGSMGIAIGDYNLDEKLDVFVTNYEHEVSALYRNNGMMNFTYGSNAAKIAATDERGVSWGTAFVDLEWDGDEDLLVINGHLERHSDHFMQRPQCLENVNGQFFRIAARDSIFFDTPQSGRGLAIADFDRDGRVDLCASRIDGPCALVRNASLTSGGRFLAIRLVGTQSNRDAIGTTIELKVGGRTWIRHIHGGGSYASTSDRFAHFGVPNEIDVSGSSLSVRWPSGLDQEYRGIDWNQTWTLVEGFDSPFAR